MAHFGLDSGSTGLCLAKWESELVPGRGFRNREATWIAREARYLNSIGDAATCIAGYCISHDISEREFQLERGGQWSKGKSCDTFNPLGPWLTTSDELPDVSKLRMTLTVNGQLMQNGSTETMIFPPAQLVHYISQFMTLEPGDLISTGTPPGVGLGMKPPRIKLPSIMPTERRRRVRGCDVPERPLRSTSRIPF